MILAWPAGGQPRRSAAFGEQFGAGGSVDCAIDSTAAEKGFVGGVDDGVDVQFRDIAFDDADSVAKRAVAWVHSIVGGVARHATSRAAPRDGREGNCGVHETSERNPHPCPPPEYMGRGKEGKLPYLDIRQ